MKGAKNMSKKLYLLAMPFSTDDSMQLEEIAKNNDSIKLDILEWISTGPLVEELVRPVVKAHTGDGVLIVDHSSKSATELLASISLLKRIDKKLYSVNLGLEPLTQEILQKSTG